MSWGPAQGLVPGRAYRVRKKPFTNPDHEGGGRARRDTRPGLLGGNALVSSREVGLVAADPDLSAAVTAASRESLRFMVILW
jgi:hypothetical protein